jgi:hypothetical protein
MNEKDTENWKDKWGRDRREIGIKRKGKAKRTIKENDKIKKVVNDRGRERRD